MEAWDGSPAAENELEEEPDVDDDAAVVDAVLVLEVADGLLCGDGAGALEGLASGRVRAAARGCVRVAVVFAEVFVVAVAVALAGAGVTGVGAAAALDASAGEGGTLATLGSLGARVGCAYVYV